MSRLEQLRLWLLVTGIAYLLSGAAFVLAPDLILGTLNAVAAMVAPSLPPIPIHPEAPERFWLALTGSMMATIATCALMATRDIERRRDMALPIVVSKLTSTVLGLLFFAASARHLAYVNIATTDLPLGVITLVLWSRARDAR